VSSSFEKSLISLSKPLLKFLVKRAHGDIEAAQDALQDTFIAASRSYHTFRHKSSLFTWVCKIGLRRLADIYRRKFNRHSTLVVPLSEKIDELIDPSLSPEEKLSLEELTIQVRECLNHLPPAYRHLLELKYYQNLSHREISVTVGISERGVEGRLYRAKLLFRKLFTQHF